MTSVERDRAVRAARFAAAAGLPVSACPYSPTGDARDKLLALVWVRTYLAASPGRAAVAYT
jgi:hypothetical protein